MEAIEGLSDFTVGFRLADAPESVISRAEDCVLDIIGAAAVGSNEPGASAVRSFASRCFPGSTAGIWFGHGTLSPPGAAAGLSAACSASDIDDGHRIALGHPGAAVVPAAFAVGQHIKASMPEIIEAIIAGYEVGIRISSARNARYNPVIASGRWVGIGAAVAAAKLMRLPPEQVMHAILLAEHHAPGMYAAQLCGFAGAAAKEGIAWATLSGVLAAEMAASGFDGYRSALDTSGLYDPEIFLKDLGRTFGVNGLYFKPYACCRWIHAAIDGLRAIMEEEDLQAEEITSVNISTFERTIGLENSRQPQSILSAQFSVPFCIAVAAVLGRDALLPLTGDTLENERVLEFAKRVTCTLDPQLERLFPAQTPARVKVTTDRTFEREVPYPFGEPANPMLRSDLQSKFLSLTRHVLEADLQHKIVRENATLRKMSAQAVFATLDARAETG